MQKLLFFYLLGILLASSTLSCEGCQKTKTETDIATDTANVTPAKSINTDEKTSLNGFKYVHHIKNEGPKPQAGEYAYFNIEIYGVIDSLSQFSFLEGSPQYNKIMPVEQTKGFTNPTVDVLYEMSIGDSISVKMPIELVTDLQKGWEGFDYLVLGIKLTDIVTPAEHNKNQIEKFNKRKQRLIEAQARIGELNATCQKTLSEYKAGSLNNKLKQTKSGLKYLIVEEGKGNNLRNGNPVNFFYCGLLMDGTVFENTFNSGMGSSIQVGHGQSLPVWDEAMTYLKFGSRAYLFVPHQLAYGEQGVAPNIPRKAEVMFYVEVME